MIVAITALLGLVMVYPFLPGSYDRLATGLSLMVQVFGLIGLLLVPVGLVWLIYESVYQQAIQRDASATYRGGIFALAAMVIASLVAVIISIAASASSGTAFGLMTIGLWVYCCLRLIRHVRRLRKTEPVHVNFAPLYLILIPIALFVLQLTLATPVTASSRAHAIAMSAELIADIEAYYAANDRYPDSLLAVWNDYSPSVIGIERYHYETSGDTYNLVFEQPRFLFDNLGAREFVVYNPLDEHTMISHDSWILLLSPRSLSDSPGWFEARNTDSPHWKSFLFD